MYQVFFLPFCYWQIGETSKKTTSLRPSSRKNTHERSFRGSRLFFPLAKELVNSRTRSQYLIILTRLAVSIKAAPRLLLFWPRGSPGRPPSRKSHYFTICLNWCLTNFHVHGFPPRVSALYGFSPLVAMAAFYQILAITRPRLGSLYFRLSRLFKSEPWYKHVSASWGDVEETLFM